MNKHFKSLKSLKTNIKTFRGLTETVLASGSVKIKSPPSKSSLRYKMALQSKNVWV